MTDNNTEPSVLTRRDFTLKSALAILAGVIITIDGCGGSSSPAAPTPTTPGTSSGDIQGSVSANHGHIATITRAELTAGNAVSLDIKGNATHSHTVEISQGDLQNLQNRRPVAKDSTNSEGHSHTVTFTPA
jgi:hypothetical protein